MKVGGECELDTRHVCSDARLKPIRWRQHDALLAAAYIVWLLIVVL